MRKKEQKDKKALAIPVIPVIAVIVIIIVVIAIIMIVRNGSDDDSTQEGQQTVISLPDTTYSDMEVTDVYMEYLEDQDQTMVSMSILNTTTNPVENERLNAILVGADGEVLGQMQTWIQSLGVGEEYDISVILNGNLTGTQSIQLDKVTE